MGGFNGVMAGPASALNYTRVSEFARCKRIIMDMVCRMILRITMVFLLFAMFMRASSNWNLYLNKDPLNPELVRPKLKVLALGPVYLLALLDNNQVVSYVFVLSNVESR